jgi:signal transduction histidine kinase
MLNGFSHEIVRENNAFMERAMSPRLLVVDDDFDMLETLQQFFCLDYEVITAFSGEKALALLDHEQFDLVILDLGLPGMHGFEVLTWIRTHFTMSELPVILLSGNDETGVIVAGLNQGANDYLIKPSHPDIMRARVRVLVELKRLYDENQEAVRSMAHTQAIQDTFLRVVSHDLKNPLNNLRTALYLLRDMLPNNPTADQIMHQADVTLNDMISMIKTFLDVARLQAGTTGSVDISLHLINISDVIRNLVGQNRLSASGKHITIESDEIGGLVLADGRLITQALGNLLDNAIKFSSPHTTVVCSTVERQGWLHISIRDHGPGIPAAERDRLFEMFAKLSPRPTGSETSTGLGLWIVKQLVTLQGGRVGADFPDDGGSRFWIELPMPQL